MSAPDIVTYDEDQVRELADTLAKKPHMMRYLVALILAEAQAPEYAQLIKCAEAYQADRVKVGAAFDAAYNKARMK